LQWNHCSSCRETGKKASYFEHTNPLESIFSFSYVKERMFIYLFSHCFVCYFENENRVKILL
jgi:hypothetical protein